MSVEKRIVFLTGTRADYGKIKSLLRVLNEDKNYKPTPEQKKEYNKQSYLKRKEKLKKEMEEKTNNENV